MRVRLVRKLADLLDGVDVSGHSSGDILELSRHDAELLIAERWAEPEAADGREQRYRRRAEDRLHDETDRRTPPRAESASASADPAREMEMKHDREVNREHLVRQRDDRDR